MSDAGLPNTAKRFAHFDNPASSDSGSSARKGVGVRVPASAPNQISSLPWNPTQLPRSEVNISQRHRQARVAGGRASPPARAQSHTLDGLDAVDVTGDVRVATLGLDGPATESTKRRKG